jgi:hypothetical protein
MVVVEFGGRGNSATDWSVGGNFFLHGSGSTKGSGVGGVVVVVRFHSPTMVESSLISSWSWPNALSSHVKVSADISLSIDVVSNILFA